MSLVFGERGRARSEGAAGGASSEVMMGWTRFVVSSFAPRRWDERRHKSMTHSQASSRLLYHILTSSSFTDTADLLLLEHPLERLLRDLLCLLDLLLVDL